MYDPLQFGAPSDQAPSLNVVSLPGSLRGRLGAISGPVGAVPPLSRMPVGPFRIYICFGARAGRKRSPFSWVWF